MAHKYKHKCKRNPNLVRDVHVPSCLMNSLLGKHEGTSILYIIVSNGHTIEWPALCFYKNLCLCTSQEGNPLQFYVMFLSSSTAR
jgi:hypothetical protein